MRIAARFLIIFGILVFVTSCAHRNPSPIDMSGAIQRATTRCDHEALAKYYEDVARELKSKLKKHKKMLESYESVTFQYGKEGLAMQSHCKALIDLYEQAAAANRELAHSHRAMAADIK